LIYRVSLVVGYCDRRLKMTEKGGGREGKTEVSRWTPSPTFQDTWSRNESLLSHPPRNDSHNR
jgi:hypothetical protein